MLLRSNQILNRVRLPKRGDHPIFHGIEALHCGGCSTRSSIKEAMSIFTKFKAPKARPSMLQSLTDFAWGTRGQSGPFAINKIAPQNVKVAMMMNNAKIPCGKCKTVRWVAGYKL